MNRDNTLAVLAAMFSTQQETGEAFDIEPDRIIAIAAGAQPTSQEGHVLLQSPLAREELVLQRHLHSLRFVAFWQARIANDNAVASLHVHSEAAASGETQSLDLRSPVGTLQVRPGPSTRVPFLLTLTLNPEWWSGFHRQRPVSVQETGPDGLVWIEGVTDGDGILRGVWPHPAERGTPAARLALLVGPSSDNDLAAGLTISIR